MKPTGPKKTFEKDYTGRKKYVPQRGAIIRGKGTGAKRR